MTFLGARLIYFASVVWPENKPTSDLVTEDAVLATPFVGGNPSLNYVVRNDTPYILTARTYSAIDVDTRPIPNREVEGERENERWESLRRNVATEQAPTINYVPRVKITGSIIYEKHPYTQEEVDSPMKNTGALSLRFMTAFIYTDGTGEHEWDQCVLIQNVNVGVHCQQHNGPSWPMPHQKWEEPK
jgi:hypothetical protein